MKERHMGFKLLDLFTKMQQEYPEFTPDKILIIDVKVMEKIVTPARVQLIEAIRNHKPKSVNDLAKIVNRPQESVSRDLTILNNYGVLEFVQVGKVRRPIIDKEIFAVSC